MRDNAAWKSLKSGFATAAVMIALGSCALSDLLDSASDMTNPDSGVPIGYGTSFATLSDSSVLTLVEHASTMSFVTDDVYGSACFGVADPRRNSPEDACLHFANVPKWRSDILDMRRSGFPGPVLNPQFDHRVGAALVRDCGQYSLNNQDGLLESGAGCGLLGAFLALEGNASAAKAVWEQAPGCHTHDIFGDPINACMRFIVGEGDTAKEGQQWLAPDGYDHLDLYSAEKPKLIAMTKAACLHEYDYSSCAYLKKKAGVNIDLVTFMAEVEHRRQEELKERDKRSRPWSTLAMAEARARTVADAADDRRIRVEESNRRAARFNALDGAPAVHARCRGQFSKQVGWAFQEFCVLSRLIND